MSYELIINSSSTGVSLALLRDKKLIELHEDKHETDFNVGDIYMGKVRKVVPSLNAAFVDVGYEKDAFLHYLDLGPQFKNQQRFVQGTLKGSQQNSDISKMRLDGDIDKDGKIKDILSSKQLIAVQVAKEPISSKGPRLSAELTLAGRYIVLVPFTDKISVSQKIKSPEERDRLRTLLASIKPKNFGVIIRTVAQNRKVAELDQDLRDLLEKWKKFHSGLRNADPQKRILGEMNRASTVLRDMLSPDFSAITVDDPNLATEIKSYVKTISPGRESIVKVYKGKKEIFEQFGIHKQIKASFGKKVMLPSGAYLIIEHTEAMHVIDVNSGNRKASEQNQEQNAIETNLEVAEEIARILRLRDMGGIIAIDFIDMHKKENNRLLHEKLKEFMADDRAKHNIIPPTRFGVVEMTRQRVRPETEIKTAEKCPSCNGTGEITASILIIDEIENNVRYLIEEKNLKSFQLMVHPFLEAYLTKGFKSIQRTWSFKYKRKIKIRGNTNLPFLKYKFIDAEDNEIDL